MHPVQALHRHGGVARRRDLLELTTRAELDAATMSRAVRIDARGRYALPDAHEALRAANALSGVLSHTSAALHWGWAVKTVPTSPHVTVRRKRRLPSSRRQGVVAHWRDLPPDDVDGAVTSPQRTVRDCICDLPFDEALAVADSALRSGRMSSAQIRAVAASTSGPGARQARRIAEQADRRAANPFESVLRATALDIKALHFVPQLTVVTQTMTAQPDLVDEARRLVLEADSHTWHSSRRALARDCRRYNALVLDDWTVLRFAWEQVMFEQTWVRSCLERAVAVTAGQARRTRSAR